MNVLEKLLYNLQTIASIPKGKRISTAKEFIVIDEDSMLQGYWRWARVDSRDKAVQSICREVRTTIAIAHYIMESQHLFLENSASKDDNCDIAITINGPATKRDERISDLKKIRAGLLEANYGIDNLCQTYEDDANVGGCLKPLLGEINDCSTQITQLLREIGEYTEPVTSRNLHNAHKQL